MARAPALPNPNAPAPTGRAFRPTLQSSTPIVPGSEADAIAKISARRRRAAPPPAAVDPPTRPEVDPAVALGVPTAPYSPLTHAIPGAPVPGAVPAPGPAAPSVVPAARVAPPALPAGGMVDVVINGQTVPVTLDELRRGYLRQQDYSAKTAAAAEQLKTAQQAHAAFDHARQQLEQRLPQIVAGLDEEFSQPIDWVKLAREDPIGYAQKDARHKAYQAAKQEQANLIELRRREDFNRKAEMRRLGHEFLAQVLPGWADPTTRQQLQALQTQHLTSVGYSPEEIAAYEALDPRQIIILEESRRFRVIAAQYPDLLRMQELTPEHPQARGVTVAAMPGNGLLGGRDPAGMAEGEAQQNWEAARDQGGRAAREAAVSLIAARRQRRAGG